MWTDWYRARLEGGPVNLALEVARVEIAEDIWKKGPRAANAEIARLIALHRLPQPVENIPSAFGFGWTAAGAIALATSPSNLPVFPFPGSERDHRDRLDACRASVHRLIL